MAAPNFVQELGAVLCTLFAIGTVRLLFNLEGFIEELGHLVVFANFALNREPFSSRDASLSPGD